ncbi:efflux RND transporter permease subunit [candidate division WOR-3 bacterium]|nr:efflux RND transporter permease subunit [candidate division WOR-3 bacterium]
MQKMLEFFISNKLLVNILIVVVFIFGIYSFLHIQQDVMPNVDFDLMFIEVFYPGASPSDVEVNAVVPIEREIAKITGIEEYTSLSIENSGSIFITIDSDVDDKQSVKDEVFRSITLGNIPDLPSEIEDIRIVDRNPKLREVYAIAVFPKDTIGVSEAELYAYVDRLEDKLLKVTGVSDVKETGYRDREIHINVNPNNAKRLQVSLNEIVQSIQTRNIRSTGGTIQSLYEEQSVVTIGQFDDPMDVGDVIIRSTFTGTRVRIKDIAHVEDGFEEENVQVRVNKEKAVVLGIVKKANADIMATVDNIENLLKNDKELASEKFDIRVVSDGSLSIDALLKVVESNAIIGFILVIVVLLIFLDFRTSFWTAFGLPISMLIVMAFMYLTGYTLNILSLCAMIMVLGMLVDDGIVIAENVYAKKRSGMSPIEATTGGTLEVIPPVVASHITTIVAFLPTLMITGRMGKFIAVFPIVVTVMLIASFFEAIFILPSHLAHSKIALKKGKDWFEPITRFYERILKKVLKWRYLVVVIFIGILIGAIFISRDTIKNFVLFYDDSAEKININLDAPKGTSLEAMADLTSEVEDRVQKIIPEELLISSMASIGKHYKRQISAEKYENWATVGIALIPKSERTATAKDIIAELRREINVKKLPQFTKIQMSAEKMGPSTGEAFNVKIIGHNKGDVDSVRAQMEAFLATIPGVKDIGNDQIEGKKELILKFNYEHLARLGLTVQDVASTVRTAYYGTNATSIETSDKRLNFRVKVDDAFQKNEKFLLQLLIPNRQGRLIRIGDVANIESRESDANVNHYDGARAVTVTADVNEEVITPSQVTRMVMEEFRDVPKLFPNIYLGVGGEARETMMSIVDLAIAFAIASLLIYLVLILLFKSLSQPFVILLTIPFGVIGALVAFTAHGIPLTFLGIIGIIGLSGVVVNDSVVMIHFINKIFAGSSAPDKKQAIDAIATGAKKRLRPIILTTVTTVAAVMPTVYGIGGTSQMIVPVVMAMAYGLLFATLLTLVFTPSLYMINTDIRRLFTGTKKMDLRRIFHRKAKKKEFIK